MTDSFRTPPAEEAEPAFDRTVSPLARPRGGPRRGRLLAAGGLLVGFAVLVAASLRPEAPDVGPPITRPARQVVTFEPAAPTLAAPGEAPPSLSGGPSPPPATASVTPVPELVPEHGPGAGPPSAAPPAPAPLLVYSRAPSAAPREPGPLVPAIAASPADPTELDRLRQPSQIGQAQARRLGDRSFLILAGATIPCLLQTAIDTATAGYVTCLVSSDVYSDNGAVVLLDKGTRVLGEYRALSRGGRRVFVLWTRAVTPDGVAIDLASPAADALGRSGFDGDLDTRFWDRFGAALLLSLVDNGSAALLPNREGPARLPSDAAAIAVGGADKIGPTLRKAQGAEVIIMAARDFDFSGVYRLRGAP